eukprot:CAMPEP_0197251054 /NCGR_PEP_ID=MMETSP1429-20130617/55516_1 /TAXON_ID=49237 /ORGANISM="Chaetoceros  sp., Strain UNC1202" /LENGTH=60 /DNA_ID=CAMNT_0042713033 /DNA_START=250 /DNA_END=429 /DNA_ORIENTATION=+
MNIVRMEFIIEGSAPDGFAALSAVAHASTLKHESAHVAMEDGVRVEVGGAESEEVEGCSG